MSIVRKLAGQTAIYGIPGILARTLNFLLAYFHLSVFPPNSYGVSVELYAYVAFIMVFLLYGMETAYFRFVQENDEKTVFNSLQTGLYFTTAIFLLGTLFNVNGIAAAIGYQASTLFIVWLLIILALDTLSAIPLVRLRNQEKPLVFVSINMASIFTNIGINLFVILYWFKNYQAGNTDFFLSEYFNPEIGVGYIFIANLISAAVKWILTLFWGIPNPLKFNVALWKKSLNYSWPLILAGLAGLTNEVADRAMIVSLLEPHVGLEKARYELGVYGGCYKLAILINICVQAFRYAAEPLFFKQVKERSDGTMIQVLNYLVAFVLLVFITVSLYLDYFKLLLRDQAYWEGLGVVPILLLANCFLAVHIQISMWYKLSDKTKLGALISIIAAVITVIGNIIMVPIIGYMGSAITTLLVYMFLPLASYFLSKKHYFIPYEIKKLAMYFGLAIGIVLLGYYLFPNLHFTLKALLILLFIAVFCYREKVLKPKHGS